MTDRLIVTIYLVSLAVIALFGLAVQIWVRL
jgi:hypothetical protein